MKILGKDELHAAEEILRGHLPKSYMVYGFLFGLNRDKPSTLEVVVDSWPQFKLILCRPDCSNKRVQEFTSKVFYFCTDEDVLKQAVMEENIIDWSSRFFLGGFDTSHEHIFEQASSRRGISHRGFTVVHLLYLPDINRLQSPTIDSDLEARVSSLDLSDTDLVNQTWKFGGDHKGYCHIKNLIANFPSCCITDAEGQPVSWLLVYDYCALGMLYTLQEHRGKGYAKVLVSTLAKTLHSEGYPVYCFIEEENQTSYKLFKHMGFIEDPSYRAAWYEFNF